MTDAAIAPEPARSAYDGWRCISLALYMTLVGYGVLVGIPVISTAWVELLGFTEVEVGRVAGADLGGLAIGAVVTSLFIGRINRRYLVLAGAAIAMLSNGLCIVYHGYEQVLLLRLAAGTGAGIYTAVAVATLGGSSNPARAYNLMLFAFAFSQALEMRVLPQLSMNGIYTVFIASFALGLVLIHWIPPRPAEKAPDARLRIAVDGKEGHPDLNQSVPKYIPWLCLTAIFLTYINIGAYWTYIELASLGAGVSGEWVGGVLVWGSFWSLVGCLVATVISNRFGLARPLFLALIAMACAVGLLAGGITDKTLLISVFSFNLLWIFVDVYQMSTVANIDQSGSYASLMPAAQGLGQIVGPNIAATLLGANLGYSSVFVMGSTAALAGLSVYAFMYFRLKRTLPALADAA